MSIQVVKERIRLVNGRLDYVQLPSRAVKATDVRIVTLPRGSFRLEFVAEKNSYTSQLTKKHGADLGFNFPHHNYSIPLGTIWADGRYINGAAGGMKEWYEWGVKGNDMVLGKFSNAYRETLDFSLMSNPPLIIDGQIASNIDDGQACQRTAIGWNYSYFFIAIADGRYSAANSYDIGLTNTEMALYLLDKGAQYAFNGDGGGSTILADKSGKGLNQSSNTGANERRNCHAVLVYLEQAAGYKDDDPITYGDLKKLGLVKG